jgi:urea transporter
MHLTNQERWKIFVEGSLKSYSMIFFSISPWFAGLVFLLTMMDPVAGLSGLLAVGMVNGLALLLGLDQAVIRRGEFGFNALLVGLGLGAFYQLNLALVLLLFFAVIITLFLTIMVMGVLTKYGLPFLSLPFVLGLWTVMLASRNFMALGVSERGLYFLNELYAVGENYLVGVYHFLNELAIPVALKTYFRSLGSILFQFNMLSGFVLSVALLFYSRIAFTLSLLGFFTAYYFYWLIGADLTELNYSIIGFNFILSAIAIGGFYLVPSVWSFLWVIVMMPVLAILTTSLTNFLATFQLGTYALPFNMVVLSLLYILKWRAVPSRPEVVVAQAFSPEKNKYQHESSLERYKNYREVPVGLPVMGEWSVAQGHAGPYTHRAEWQHAWDFVIEDEAGQQFQNDGLELTDYYCYDQPVVAPADGTVIDILDDVSDNVVGEMNLRQNWGNSILLEHGYALYAQLSHIKAGSFQVKKGDHVRKGQVIGRCGNSGRSPYPHLHFQFQTTPYIGAVTLEYPISLYWSKDQAGAPRFHFFDYPAAGDTVQQVEAEPLLKQAFYFVPGKTIRVRTDDGKTVAWECKTDAYNHTYLECTQTGARAYFQNNGVLHYFTTYYGKRDALLYHFFLANYKVALGFAPGLTIRDSIPLDLLPAGPFRWVQDLLAPFYQYTRAGFELSYRHPRGALALEAVELEAQVVLRHFGKEATLVRYATQIGDSGITGFRITKAGRATEATILPAGEDPQAPANGAV